jgi:hypothetical protein
MIHRRRARYHAKFRALGLAAPARMVQGVATAHAAVISSISTPEKTDEKYMTLRFH